MYNFLLVIQYIGIIAIFIETWLVFRSWKDLLRAYLFFSCIATLICNFGYLLELKATTEEAYITALFTSYAGRVWITFALFLFTMELCKINLSRRFVRVLVCIHIGIYICVLTIRYNSLYYSSMTFSKGDVLPIFEHGNGPVHHIFMLLQGVYIVLGLTALFFTYRKVKKNSAKRRMRMIIIALFLEAVFFILEIISPVKGYDFNMVGTVVGTAVMYVSIFRFDLLGTKDIAREFMVDRLSEGVIAVDNEGDTQYFNIPAKSLFPDLATDPDGVVDKVRNAILRGETIEKNDRIYTPEENDLLYKGESFGKLYVLIDSTEHYQRLNNEKKSLTKELLTDPLTGFYNRKGMESYSDKILNDVIEGKSILFLCVADMNGLKYINDNFGHEHGDRAIMMLSKIIRESLLEGDMAFRTGGDEFLIMGKREEGDDPIKDFCDRMEDIIKRNNENSDLPYKIDMSYGPVTGKLTGREGELDELIKESDKKMYEMKKNRDVHIR